MIRAEVVMAVIDCSRSFRPAVTTMKEGGCGHDHPSVADPPDENAERLRLLVSLRQLDISLPIAAKLATMCADER
jgi:hypothetical protein